MGIQQFKEERDRLHGQDPADRRLTREEEARRREAFRLRVQTGIEAFTLGGQAIKGAFRADVAVQEPPLDKGYAGGARKRTVTTPFEVFLEGCEIAVRASQRRNSPTRPGRASKFITKGIDLLVSTEGGPDVYAHVASVAEPIDYKTEHPEPFEVLDAQVILAITSLNDAMQRRSLEVAGA